MKKAVRLSDIAKVHNVSVVTVSNALAGRKGVRAQLRTDIIDTAKAMGYCSGETKQPKEVNSICILARKRWFNASDSFFWELYRNLVRAANARNCLILFDLLDDDDMMIPNSVRMNKVDGIILVGRQPVGYIERLKAGCTYPVVFVDFYESDIMCDAVIPPSFLGEYLMTNLLINAGHRDIAFVGSMAASNSITDRYYGYLKALREHGIEERAEWCIDDRTSSGVIDVKLPETLPTAFACCTDLTAVAVIEKLREIGLSVPEDVSVVGYDGYLPEGYRDIELTTYAVDIEQMALRGVDMLLKKIENEDVHTEMMTIPGKIIPGRTVNNRKNLDEGKGD